MAYYPYDLACSDCGCSRDGTSGSVGEYFDEKDKRRKWLCGYCGVTRCMAHSIYANKSECKVRSVNEEIAKVDYSNDGYTGRRIW
jgi:hypothetical protein